MTLTCVEFISSITHNQDWTKEKNRDTNTRTPNRRALTYPSPKTVEEWGPPQPRDGTAREMRSLPTRGAGQIELLQLFEGAGIEV